MYPVTANQRTASGCITKTVGAKQGVGSETTSWMSESPSVEAGNGPVLGYGAVSRAQLPAGARKLAAALKSCAGP